MVLEALEKCTVCLNACFSNSFFGRVGVLLHLTQKLQTRDLKGRTVKRDSFKTVASRFRLRTETLNAEFTHGIRAREWPILLSGTWWTTKRQPVHPIGEQVQRIPSAGCALHGLNRLLHWGSATGKLRKLSERWLKLASLKAGGDVPLLLRSGHGAALLSEALETSSMWIIAKLLVWMGDMIQVTGEFPGWSSLLTKTGSFLATVDDGKDQLALRADEVGVKNEVIATVDSLDDK